MLKRTYTYDANNRIVYHGDDKTFLEHVGSMGHNLVLAVSKYEDEVGVVHLVCVMESVYPPSAGQDCLFCEDVPRPYASLRGLGRLHRAVTCLACISNSGALDP